MRRREVDEPFNFPNQELENNEENGKMGRMDLPRFNGEDPDGWLMEAEKHFTLYTLSEEEKKEVAAVFLDGEALLWYQWEHQRSSIKDWQGLKSLLLRKFKPIDVGNLYERRMFVEQGGAMADYRWKVMGRVTHFQRKPKANLNWAFLRKLNDNIKIEERVLGPTNREQTRQEVEKVDRKRGTTTWWGRWYRGRGVRDRCYGESSSGKRYQHDSASKQQNPNSINPNFAN